MYLRNFEKEAGTANPISGAVVTIYTAILSGAHGGPVSFTDHNGVFGPSTTTNPDGMWAATDLPDGAYYDVKVTYNSQIKWYMGRTKHQIEHLYDDTTPDLNRNLLPNGGLDQFNIKGTGGIALPAADPGDVTVCADGWQAYGGAGDSGTVTAESTTKSTNSFMSQKVAYNRAGGANQAILARFIPSPVAYQLRGQTVSVSFQVYQQTTTSGLRAFLTDGITTVFSASTASVDSFVTLTVSLAVGAAATTLRAGVQTQRAGTGTLNFFVDNAVLDLGSVPPVFAPDMFDVSQAVIYTSVDDTQVPATDGNTLDKILDNLGNRLKAITGAAGWKTDPSSTIAAIKTAADALASTVTALAVSVTAGLALKVAKAGDTMTGTLIMAATKRIEFLEDATHTWDIVASGGAFFIANVAGTGVPQFRIDANGLFFYDGTAFRKVMHTHNGGAGSLFDADLLDSQSSSFYLDRTNHTGSQTVASISDFVSAGNALWAALAHNHVVASITDFVSAGNALWASLVHTHTGYGNLSGLTFTYSGLSPFGTRVISLGVTWVPIFATVQVVSGGASTIYFLVNHDGIGVNPGSPGTVSPALVGPSFGLGTVTVPAQLNQTGIGYRITVFGG